MEPCANEVAKAENAIKKNKKTGLATPLAHGQGGTFGRLGGGVW